MSGSEMDESGRQERPLILVTRATGHVGGRLVRPLLEAGFRVRVLIGGGLWPLLVLYGCD